MASSLALQLAQNASLNSALLTDRSKKRAPESYLFSAKDADAYDLESILALATNALLQLALLNPDFSPFENTLFSRASKGTDRTLLAKDANKQLDKSIGKFLSLLGPYVMEPPAGKVLEWLVRRYRVQEFNVDQILATFLPYHESPHFASMLSILHIKPNSTWSFLLPTKSAALPLSRYTLVTEMLKNTDVTRFIINLLPDNLKKKSGPPPHRTLLAFNLSCLHDFISRSKRLDEGTMVALLPALLEPMQNVDAPRDALLGSYILLTVLSQKCDLSEVALKAIIAAMSSCAVRVTTRQFFSAAIAVASPQPLCSSAFSNTVVDNILSLEDIEAELSEAATWVGFDKLVAPILPRLVEKDEAETVLADLLAKQTTPDEILISISQSLLKHLISNPASVSTRHLLSSFHLRKPDLLKSASERILEENEELETRVDQVLLSLAVPATSSASTTGNTQLDADAVVRSMDADESVRISGIQTLLNAGVAQAKPIYPALLTRIQDSSISVLNALYTPTFASLILETDPMAYCNALIPVFSSTSGMKRALVRTHLTFLLTHIYVHLSEELEDNVFWQCIFPFLLYTKPREKTCEAVWDAIRDVQIDVLKGCCAIFLSAKEKGSEVMGKVVQRMAENVVGSDRFDRHLTGLVERLAVGGKGKPDGHVVNLSWMVLKVMVETLKGSELQVDVALRVLDVDEGERLSEQDWSKWSFEKDILDETSLSRHVMGKPNSSNTPALLRIAFLHTVVSSISPPPGIVLDWLTSSPPREHVQGARYVTLARRVWDLIQTSNSGSPTISTQLRSTHFGTLGSANILLFLAGIWSSQSNSPSQQENALDYGRAYLQAHLPRDQVQDPVAVDFQTILPSLLVALQSTAEGVRRRALACVRVLSEITERKKFEGGQSPLFGFDVVYGATNREIQYLEQNDLKKYLKIILEHEDHLLNDPQYLSAVHQEYIKSKSGEKKKEAEFKHHIRCYLFSHVNAFLLPTGQIALLRCLRGISDSDRVDILEHSIESVVRIETRGAMDNIYGEHFEEFSALILESFDAGCKDEMNKGSEDEGVAWKLFCRSLRAFVPSGGSSVIKEALDRTVQTSLYPALSVVRKVDLINVVLEIGASDPSAYPPARVFLLKLDLEVAVIAKVLVHLQPKDEHSSPAPKKARLSTHSEDPVPRLSLFAEVLASALLPDSMELISHLLTTLNSVVLHVAQQQTDVNYLEQLLMTAVDKVASQIMDPPNITPSTIRLDVLVELIRVSGNPQTFQQALLLTAALAKLAPESVMRHIMPVFTFMGSNVFHRDDTYSFRVVQKTIESIVPVMISSLRQSTTDRISLYLGARDLLRVFVDAYNHIPRHRRTSLFIHLIDTLGPTDFLAPVCMLLTEKFATRVVRQRSEDAQNTLALPLAVLHHYSPPLQLFVLTEVLREARRLAMRLNDLRDVEPHLLDWATQDDRSPAINTLLRKRSQALIIFSGLGMKGGRPSHVGQAADMPSEGSIHDFVFLLMSLFTLEGSPDLKLEELSTAAMVALNRSMGFMAAKDFIHSVVMILDSGQEKLQSGALALLAERLHLVTEKTRRDSQANMLKIIKEIHVLAKKNLDAAIVPQALQALAVIGKTMLIGEENSLSETLPVVLLALRHRKCTEDALSALSPMSERLGPRLIPHFRELVTQCVAVMRETSSSQRTSTTCLEILSNLLRTIPSFWSQKEIAQVVMLYISSATADSLYLSLGKTLSKRAPAEALVATLIDCWVEIPKQTSHLLSYFQLLKRALRVASKQVIIEYTRAVFDVFVKGLDVLKDLRNATEAENALIGSFIELVVKLNDTAFRPLFRKLYDWAFVKESSNDSTKIIFCHLFYGLLDYFKSLMSPYMTFLFPPFSEVLKTVPGGGPTDYMLWSGVVSALSASMNCDEGNIFWRDDKLTTLLPALVSQIPHVARASTHLKDQLSSALSALAEVTSSTSSDILKQLNLTVLMHTRSSSAAVRQYALVIAESLWGTHGGKLLGFVADAATFIVESAEDENEEVVKMALKLKETIENIAGKIDLS
ncbi:armadillo-type protein [Flagelloscypha sp. PMI_526]|nr:armadillo-type protein [Flagelloscypha sp. PMI_526]